MSKLKREILKIGAINLIATLVLFVTFVSLGFWQLSRASDMKSAGKIKPDMNPVLIEKIAKPNSNLKSSAVNRLVTIKGRYIKSYIAGNQLVVIDGVKDRKDLEVRLMKLNSGSGLLVVRGYENMNDQVMPKEVKVLGRLYPRQSSDVSKPEGNHLTRLDPSIITGDTNLNLIDGYVIAIDEKTNLGEPIFTDRVPAEVQVPRVAGYYWQHLTYVGIWWLFALLVLMAPFYEMLRDRKVRVG